MIRTDGWALRQRAPDTAARTLLQTLADVGGRAEDLIALAHTAEPTADAATLYYLLTRLEQRATRPSRGRHFPFRRSMSWKYQGMAYAAILKHVGVMYQQLYLVTTALGLAPCAIGAGNSDRFAAAARTHYYEETSVGEFVVSGTPG